MNKLLSIISTYEDTFKLYAKVFIPLLPFTLLNAVAEHFYNDYIQQFNVAIQNGQAFNGKILFAVYVSYILVYCLIFSIALYGVAQYKNAHSFNYPQALEKGASRTPSLLLSIVILVGPIALIAIGLILVSSHSSPEVSLVLNIMLIIAGTMFIIAFIYLYVASALIIVRDYSAVNGLAQSYRLTKGHWWKTFLILLIVGAAVALTAYGLAKFTPEYADEIITIIVFPLSCALMLIHMENLERAYQAPSTPAVVVEKKET